MTTLSCIAIDDEPLALELMEEYIRKVPFLKLVKKCSSASSAFDVLHNEKIDLLFLDIQMPDVTGISFLKSLRAVPMVIFTTAYDQYALEGFELDAIDYLLKPIPFERFLKAANKALEYAELKNKSMADPSSHSTEVRNDFIFVKSDYKIIKINFNEILYIEGLKDYIKIYTTTAERAVMTIHTMKAIEEKLPSGEFIRVHRSFIIPFSKIISIQKNRIRIKEHEIPIGDNYRGELMRRIGEKE